MRQFFMGIVILGVSVLGLDRLDSAHGASKGEIDREVQTALQTLYDTEPGAKELQGKAKGILVFPNIVKGGFIIGGQYGEGALLKSGRTVGYYNSVAASYGLQAGVQSFGYALFFMSDEDLGYLEESNGWELGSGPSVVIADSGMAKSLSTTTLQEGVFAFFFSQRGLMAGLGLQGTKITKIEKP